jgi:hypothetical protein
MTIDESTIGLLQEANGIIEQIDVAARILILRVAGVRTTFNLPHDCAIIMRAEPDKLCLLQPGDSAFVMYRRMPWGCRAQAVHAFSHPVETWRGEQRATANIAEKMTWMLIGIPMPRLAEVAFDIKRISDLPGVVCESAEADLLLMHATTN